MVGQAVEQRGGHLGIAEHAGPFAEGEVGCDNDRGAFVEATNKVEQELATGLSEWEIAEFVEDNEVHACQMFCEPALASVAGLALEPVDQIDDVVEPVAGAAANAASSNRDSQMGLAGTGAADQNSVAPLGKEGAAGEIANERLVDRGARELEVVEILGERQLGKW